MAVTPDPGKAAGDSIVRFGPFELDLRAAELRKHGTRIRLQDQPFQILRMLLDSPGQIVSREEIQNRLWPDHTIVEFDHSISAAVRRLRDALQDSADKPRYIETIARRGYRFIASLDAPGQPAPRGDVAVVAAVNGTANRNTAPPIPTEPLPERANPRILVLASIAALLVGIWAGAEYYKRAARSSAVLQPLVRLDLELGSASPESAHGPDAILSPNGSRLVYVSQSKLFTRQLDQSTATELPGTNGAEAPFFSPDGQWVAFFAGATLKKVSVQGGPIISLCDSPGNAGGTWGDDGTIVTTADFSLWRVPAGGGKATRLTELAVGESAHRWPQLLPGAKAVLFSAYSSTTGVEGASIEVLTLPDRHRKTLVRGGTWGHYLTSGHLIYLERGKLFGIRFDPDRLEVRGSPTPVLQEVAYSTAWGYAHVDVSATGTLVYQSSRSGDDMVVVRSVDESGNNTPVLPVPGNYSFPTLSRDGRRLALISAGDIWVYELASGSMIRATFGGGYSFPVWTADDRYLVFHGARGMLWTRANGTDQPHVLTQSDQPQNPQSVSPDGKKLAFVQISSTTGADIWMLPLESNSSELSAGKPEVFLQTPYHERGPTFSPDGRWLAYFSNESGSYRVYVESVAHKGNKWQIPTEAISGPIWSRNGKDLFLVHWSNPPEVLALPYTSHGDSFVADTPRVWSTKIKQFTATRSFEPGPDGQHIIMLLPAETPQKRQDQLIFLLNFFDELRRRVP